MKRPTLKVVLPSIESPAGSVEIDGLPVVLRRADLVMEAGRLTTALIDFHPEHLEVDLDARCLRLNGARLPEEVGRAFLAQLKELYPDAP